MQWPKALQHIAEAACCPVDSLAGSSSLPSMALRVRQEHSMARYHVGYQKWGRIMATFQETTIIVDCDLPCFLGIAALLITRSLDPSI